MEKTISFFDLDHTLLRGNCSFHFGIFLYRNRVIGAGILVRLLWSYFLHKFGRLSILAIHHKSFECLFQGRERREFQNYALNFVETSYNGLINTDVLKILHEKKLRGEQVAILSSSPEFLVEAFGKKMNVSDCYGTVYQTNEKGRYQYVARVLEGLEKSKLVKQILAKHDIPFVNSSGYSDSHHDIEFLETVATPIAVNPNKRLLKVCLERGWEVIDC